MNCKTLGRFQKILKNKETDPQLGSNLLRKWFKQFDVQMWDRQFEVDVKAGRLDRIAEQALADYDAGNVQEL